MRNPYAALRCRHRTTNTMPTRLLCALFALTVADAFTVPSFGAPTALGRRTMSTPKIVDTCRPRTRVGKRRSGSQLLAMKDEEPKYSDEELRAMEDELKDSAGWLGYVAPRPIRKAAWAVLGANSLWGALILFGKYGASVRGEDLDKITGNVATAFVFAALLAWEFADQGSRKARRTNLRQKQIELGDREVYERVDPTTGETRKFSKLKGVDDEWILRRIDRWGVVETAQTRGNPLPTIGPAKGAVVEELVKELQPKFILDIGSFVGYAAIRMGRSQPEGGVTVTLEKVLRWHVAARRFVWQSKLWQQYPWEDPPTRKVECLLGDALDEELLKRVKDQYGPADMIFIDGAMKEYLAYLEKAEAVGLVVPGRTTVVADNAEVFKDLDGVKQYLEYVRTSGKYASRTIASTLEYRDDTPDAIEVSTALPGWGESSGSAQAAAGSAAASGAPSLKADAPTASDSESMQSA